MEKRTQVLIVGLQPELIDFSSPEYAAFPGLTAEKVLAGLHAGAASLRALGYDTQICLTDFGATADTVLRNELNQKEYDCVLVGAGVRTVPTFTRMHPAQKYVLTPIQATRPRL